MVEQLATVREWFGHVDVSCVFSPGYLPADRGEAAVRMYAEQVVPALDPAPAGVA